MSKNPEHLKHVTTVGGSYTVERGQMKQQVAPPQTKEEAAAEAKATAKAEAPTKPTKTDKGA